MGKLILPNSIEHTCVNGNSGAVAGGLLSASSRDDYTSLDRFSPETENTINDIMVNASNEEGLDQDQICELIQSRLRSLTKLKAASLAPKLLDMLEDMLKADTVSDKVRLDISKKVLDLAMDDTVQEKPNNNRNITIVFGDQTINTVQVQDTISAKEVLNTPSSQPTQTILEQADEA